MAIAVELTNLCATQFLVEVGVGKPVFGVDNAQWCTDLTMRHGENHRAGDHINQIQI